jgi:hypothetical protein
MPHRQTQCTAKLAMPVGRLHSRAARSSQQAFTLINANIGNPQGVARQAQLATSCTAWGQQLRLLLLAIRPHS